ncbi:helix-turn-helix transcriptional regulator [Comamonas sp. MYb396]|uniref:helix-turn-helix transcriptional regulator n=1 Tax=Comamonas sp. MYb396 TaxID=2745302 RepID=UPI0030A81719
MRVLKLKDVLSKTGLGKTSLYKLVSLSEFPKPISLGLRSVGWLESEIEAWIQEKIHVRDQQLV